jgi:sensor domain CHASE-containing protein
VAMKTKIHITVETDIDKSIRKIASMKSELLKSPRIELTDFDNLSALYNYILKLGLIKLSEIRGEK